MPERGGNPDGPEDVGGGSFLEGDVNANGRRTAA
jgi:hypothetical protein